MNAAVAEVENFKMVKQQNIQTEMDVMKIVRGYVKRTPPIKGELSYLIKEFLVQKRFMHKGSNDQKLLALDYCPGAELFMLLRSKRRLEIPSVKFYAANIILGLEALHSLGIVYRDLKPENVLIGADGYTKLCDFGLSLITEPPVIYRQEKEQDYNNCSYDKDPLNSSFSSSNSSLQGFKSQDGSATTFFGTFEYTPPEFF